MICSFRNLEITVYLIFWIGINVYALYKNFVEQNEIIEKNPQLLNSLRDLGPGWAFLRRPKDYFDVEWSSWKYYMKKSWFYLLVNFIASETVRRIWPLALKQWYILSSIIYVLVFMGFRQLLVVLAQPIIYTAVIFLGGKKVIVWIISIILLTSYNSLKYKFYFWYFLENDTLQDEEVYLLLFAIAWIELRCISFSIDYIDKQKVKGIKEKKPLPKYQHAINMFSYVLYLPLLYVGPVMLYEEFENSFQGTNVKLFLRLKRFVIDMTLFIIYAFIMEFAFHYMYFYALQENIKMISKMSSLAIVGGGLWMGFQFHLKYVISYGTSGAFARLDNMEPPPTPRCIARIHVYSQMWRYFDVGLYKFLVKYIYRPGYGTLSMYISVSKIVYKLIASFFTFAFIFAWHGTVWNIFVWSVLNYIGIILEYSAKAISVTDGYKRFKRNWLKTDANEVRFVALLCSPLLVISAISNFYLFGGSEVGDMFFGLLHYPAVYNIMIVLIAVYCCCNVSITLQDVPSRTDVKKFC